MESGSAGNHCGVFQNIVHYMLLKIIAQCLAGWHFTIKGGRISIHRVSVGADMKHGVHSQQEDDTDCTQHIMADAFMLLPKVCSEITCQRSAQKLPAKGQHREPLPKPVDTRIQWHHSSWPHTMATPHPGIWQQPCCSTTPGGWLLPGLECPNPKPDQWKGVA